MKARTPKFHGDRFPPEIISHAVWLYYRFCLSFRDVEDLLAERGIFVSHESIRQTLRQQPGRSLAPAYSTPGATDAQV
jgi:putative transposase